MLELNENITDNEIVEAFDSPENKYSVVNLKPKDSIAQTFLIKAPGNDNLVLRLVSGKSNGEAVKRLTASDKVIHVYLMSLSASGNEVKLKGGLGDDPLGVISTIFDTIFSTAKLIKAQAVLFRFTNNQMKGKAKVLQRVIDRLIRARSGGKYISVEEIQDLGKKYAYVMAKAKSVAIEDISILPKVDTKEFKSVNTSVGDVYIDNNTGKQVSKDYVIAKAIADEAEETSPQTILRKTKISRRELLDAQFGNYTWVPGKTDSPEFNNLVNNPPIYSSNKDEVSSITDFETDYQKRVGNIPTKDEVSDIITTAFGPDYDDEYDRSYYLKNQFNSLVKDSSTIKPYISSFIKSNIRIDKQKELITVLGNMLTIQKDLSQNKITVQDCIKKSFNDISKLSDTLDAATNRMLKKAVISHFTISATNAIEAKYYKYKPEQYSEKEAEEIKEYTGARYSSINKSLFNGDYDNAKDKIKTSIRIIDEAFKKGETLPKNIALYRSQNLDIKLLKSTLENKIFYFGNYVSTSLKPIIYDIDFMDHTDDVISAEPIQSLDVDYQPSNEPTLVAFIIYGADKIKTIIPGKLSYSIYEAEVILPRGVIVKINSVSGTNKSKLAGIKDSYIMESEIISPELIESQEIYDGDLFMKEGKIEKISGFRTFKKDSLYEAVKFDNNEQLLSELLEFVNFDNIPEKFK